MWDQLNNKIAIIFQTGIDGVHGFGIGVLLSVGLSSREALHSQLTHQTWRVDTRGTQVRARVFRKHTFTQSAYTPDLENGHTRHTGQGTGVLETYLYTVSLHTRPGEWTHAAHRAGHGCFGNIPLHSQLTHQTWRVDTRGRAGHGCFGNIPLHSQLTHQTWRVDTRGTQVRARVFWKHTFTQSAYTTDLESGHTRHTGQGTGVLETYLYTVSLHTRPGEWTHAAHRAGHGCFGNIFLHSQLTHQTWRVDTRGTQGRARVFWKHIFTQSAYTPDLESAHAAGQGTGVFETYLYTVSVHTRPGEYIHGRAGHGCFRNILLHSQLTHQT